MSNARRLRGRDWAPLSRDLQHIWGAVPADRLRAGIEQMVPGFLDQAVAAAMETGRAHATLCARARAAEPGTFHERQPGQVPAAILDELHGLFLRVITELDTGERRHCPHVTPRTPVPAVAPVFDDWISCLRCLPRYNRRPVLTEQEEYTCDLCGRFRLGQTMDALYPAVRHVILYVGICPRCRARICGASS